ncbi:uncharacterized protein [Prorops nasuta]|uniref:uncharacterized protein n=1 Tax=Prorops nasuta TaxID=863751 RepID=UPI0034CD51FD
MTTKTNLEYTANTYNSGIPMGRDSPGALLDMLAEVASQTLHSEKSRNNLLISSKCKDRNSEIVKRKSQDIYYTIPQLLAMPVSQLVKQFSIFTSDELKRQYSYTCSLISGCEQKYTSFAGEGKARALIKDHLTKHLEELKVNKEAYSSFTVASIRNKVGKANNHNKKSKYQQIRKPPQETLNKENKDISQENSTNYLRKILSSEMPFQNIEKSKFIEKPIANLKELRLSEAKKIDEDDEFKVLNDHSYYERLADDTPKETITYLNDAIENGSNEENIVLMVVGADSIHMKEYPYIDETVSEHINENGSDTVYLTDFSWPESKQNHTKPKGKAKFIGTSKEEREMALAFMERIKKKGNPSGNNLQCRICDPPRSFTAPTTLVSHYRSHAGIKPYECRICRAVFTRRHSLKYHMLIHQNQTRFTCADCGKKFRHPSHFREHRRRHTGEAPFGCDDCGQRFKTRNTYKRHLKTRHGKVLTTTGELLYLSEEDFQKVRTSRKKRVYNTEVKATINYDNNVASEATIDDHAVGDNIEEKELEAEIIAGIERYNVRNNDNNAIEETLNTRRMVRVIKDKSFENYNILLESPSIKTEITKTDILSIKYTDSNKSLHMINEENCDKIESIPHVFYCERQVEGIGCNESLYIEKHEREMFDTMEERSIQGIKTELTTEKHSDASMMHYNDHSNNFNKPREDSNKFSNLTGSEEGNNGYVLNDDNVPTVQYEEEYESISEDHFEHKRSNESTNIAVNEEAIRLLGGFRDAKQFDKVLIYGSDYSM